MLHGLSQRSLLTSSAFGRPRLGPGPCARHARESLSFLLPRSQRGLGVTRDAARAALSRRLAGTWQFGVRGRHSAPAGGGSRNESRLSAVSGGTVLMAL